MHEQVIYFGAPGTGKSFLVNKHLIDNSVPDENVFRVTVFPEFSYSDFIGQLLPYETPSGNIKFEFDEGQFVKALKKAFQDNSVDVYLVLEEISRGNIAAIFGDVFQLLDRDEEFKSNFKIKNKNIASRIPSLRTDDVYLPSNLNIICTVNTNDQNVYPMDTAFKRRFDWKYVSTMPRIDQATNAVDVGLNNPLLTVRYFKNGLDQSFDISWLSFYCSLNEFITNKINGLGQKEDKQVGQFFIKFSPTLCDDTKSATASVSAKALSDVGNIIRDKLLVYLWQDVQSASFFGNSKSLFSKDMTDFNTLYSGYDKVQVFSDDFIENFLVPNKSNYR